MHGMQKDTKNDFIANDDKRNVHVYNTTQKLTFMGKNFAHFIENHLEAFFLKIIGFLKQEIHGYNMKVIETSRMPL